MTASYTVPELSLDELTLIRIAIGIMQLAERVEGGKPPKLPYPAPLQLGFSQLSKFCLLKGVARPKSVPDLLSWCQQSPLKDWPLDLPEYNFSSDDTLLDDQIPTQVCSNLAELAGSNSQVLAELTQKRIIYSVFEISQQANAPDAYVEFRRFIITHPVATESELVKKRLKLAPEALTKPLEEAYEPAPDSCLVGDCYQCCPNCGNLLRHHIKKGRVCDMCDYAGDGATETRIKKQEEVYWLKQGLRRYIATPGIPELRLEKQLQELGGNLEVKLWPEFDRYDLRIVFPDGEAWAIDVKDWKNSFALAKKVEPIPSDPPWERAYFVFPDERRKQSYYLNAFREAAERVLKNKTDALFESELIDKVKNKLGM
jgi:hypothetical protein